MSKRKGFEEFCRRTRPPVSIARDWLGGNGEYISVEARVAWRAWNYLEKQHACLDKVKEMNRCTPEQRPVALPASHEERMTQMFRRDDVLSALDDAGITYTVPPVDDGV